MLKKEDVYFRCLERWNANDEKTAYFKQHYDEWFSQLPEEIHEVVFASGVTNRQMSGVHSRK